MKKTIRLGIALMGIGLSTMGTVHADGNTANITATVTINTAPCEINNNQTIDVNFGDSVVTTDVMAGRVERPMNYTLNCSNADATKALKMRIAGNSTSFNETLLLTTIPDLGVKIKANGADYPINTDLTFSSGEAKPELVAVLTGKPGARLPTGGFSAGATMTVDYQ